MMSTKERQRERERERERKRKRIRLVVEYIYSLSREYRDAGIAWDRIEIKISLFFTRSLLKYGYRNLMTSLTESQYRSKVVLCNSE